MADLIPAPADGRYDDPSTERLQRKQRLAAAFRLFSRFGFDEGIAGHITARDPERLDHFWVNPYGMHFGHVRVSDLILVNDQGEVVEGEGPLNRAAFAIHSQVHAARPDVVAAAHAHSLHGRAWSSLGSAARTHHPGRVRLLRGPRALRRLHGRRPRHRRGQAHRPRPRGAQGGHPAQPRTAHRRPVRRVRRPGGSSPWSARATPSCWPRRRAPRCTSTPRWPG